MTDVDSTSGHDTTTDEEELEVTEVDHKNEYEVQTSQLPSGQDMRKFLESDQVTPNQKGDPTTNITDRMTNRPYNIPQRSIQKFFTLLEQCRREKLSVSFSEMQQPFSGLMYDFDIYQDLKTSQLTPQLLQNLCQQIGDMIASRLELEPLKTNNQICIPMCVTGRQTVSYREDHECNKDGIHILIPTIMVERNVKKYLIQAMKSYDTITQALGSLELAKAKPNSPIPKLRQDFKVEDVLDEGSAYVPVHTLGCASKPGSQPYKLFHFFDVICTESKTSDGKRLVIASENLDLKKYYNKAFSVSQLSTASATRAKTKEVKKDKHALRDDFKKLQRKLNKTCLTQTAAQETDFNFSLEFCLSFESKIFKKFKTSLKPRYMEEMLRLGKKKVEEHIQQDDEDDLPREESEVSLLGVHDAQSIEIRKLLDILNPDRAAHHNSKRDVIWALCSNKSYKALAEYFCRKCPADYDQNKIDEMWEYGMRTRKSGGFNIGSLRWWASQDNPERYKQLRNQTVSGMITKKVYDCIKEGKMSHADIADILYTLTKHKYKTDYFEGTKEKTWWEFILEQEQSLEGEMYKWYRWDDACPNSLYRYMSDVLPEIFKTIAMGVKEKMDKSTDQLAKYYKKVYENFKTSINLLGHYPFKMAVLKEAASKFLQRGFSQQLDKDPMVRGVRNGVLKLSTNGGKPILIQGYHTFPVSKYTSAPYISFNPRDPKTKKIVTVIRSMHPDNETDTHDWLMFYLASALDSRDKEPMQVIMVAGGANGKSTIVELMKGAIGDFAQKLPHAFVTTRNKNSDGPTPSIELLRDASLVYTSESDKQEELNAAGVKERTGGENIASRAMFGKKMINFKPKCHFIALSNNDFIIRSNDHGTWRRIVYIRLRITFKDMSCETCDPNDPLQRPADPEISEHWINDPEIIGRFLGYLVWFHYNLQVKYGGKVKAVPHPHIITETNMYRAREDRIQNFINECLVKTSDPNKLVMFQTELQEYETWYKIKYSSEAPKSYISDFRVCELFRKPGVLCEKREGTFIRGYRIKKHGQPLEEGEQYAMQDVMQIAHPADNYGIKSETPEEYWERLCQEYDKIANIFDGELEHDDPERKTESKTISHKTPKMETMVVNGRIMPRVEVKTLDSAGDFYGPVRNMLTGKISMSDIDKSVEEMCKLLPNYKDDLPILDRTNECSDAECSDAQPGDAQRGDAQRGDIRKHTIKKSLNKKTTKKSHSIKTEWIEVEKAIGMHNDEHASESDDE